MKYRVTAVVDVQFDVNDDGDEELLDVMLKILALPEVRLVRKIQRVITEEVHDTVGGKAL
jgi:hypothetical protein